MADNVYRVVEVVGTSSESISEAINNAVKRASATLRHLRWFEVINTRGYIEEGKLAYYQVTLKIGFTLED
jgi:hypothetical protein